MKVVEIVFCCSGSSERFPRCLKSGRAMPVRWLTLARLIILSVVIAEAATGPSSGDVFTSSFLVRFKRNVDTEYAHEIANKYGYDNLGTVGGYDGEVVVVV